MRVLKYVVGLFVAAIALVLIAGLFLPKDFRVEREIEINAPPTTVFDEVNSLQKWDAWSPWIARDPTIKNTFSGPESGVGSKVSWTSEDSGEGTQEITKSESPSVIETHLDFGDRGQADADWSFEPIEGGDATLVTWGLTGNSPGPLGGYFARMMDDWVGADYEDGLRRLKTVVESGGGTDTSAGTDVDLAADEVLGDAGADTGTEAAADADAGTATDAAAQ